MRNLDLRLQFYNDDESIVLTLVLIVYERERVRTTTNRARATNNTIVDLAIAQL